MFVPGICQNNDAVPSLPVRQIAAQILLFGAEIIKVLGQGRNGDEEACSVG